MQFINIFLILILLSAVVTPSYAQNKEALDEWLRVLPLSSNKEDVEKLFGKGELLGYTAEYRMADKLIFVDYDAGNCKSDWSFYNVPEWTVRRVMYSFTRRKLKIRNLKLKKERYELKPIGDVADNWGYYDDERGIEISFLKSNSRVLDIVLWPSNKVAEKYDCKK